MKKVALFVAAMAFMAMSATSCSSSNNKSEATDTATETVEEQQPEQPQATVTPAAPGEVVNLSNDSQFTPDAKVGTFTVLDFNAVWCVPCKKLTPAFDLAAKALGDKVEFYSVDIDKCPETAKAFNITSVPTVIFLTPNGEVKRYEGLGPFVGDANPAPDEMTQLILKNLTEMITKSL